MLGITTTLKKLISKTNKTPNIILEIDGLSTILGTGVVGKYARYGDADIPSYGESGEFRYGKPYPISDQETLISIDQTTTTIVQQMEPDKPGASSTSSLRIRIVDKNGWATNLITPGQVLPDILGVKVKIYFNVEGGAHPDDSVLLMVGTIDRVTSGAGFVDLNVTSSDRLKNQVLFQKASTKLSSGIGSGTIGAIDVTSSSSFLDISEASSDILERYIRIDDEIIRYNSIPSPTQINVIQRAQFGTIAVSHDASAPVESFYRITGDDAVTSALKLMLSNGDSPWVNGVDIVGFNFDGVSTTLTNAVFFSSYNVEDVYSLVEGDTVSIIGASNGANNVTDAEITGFGTTDFGSYILLEGESLVNEVASGVTASFKSKYNTISGVGLGLDPDQVAVKEFEQILDFYSANIHLVDLYIKDTYTGRELIDEILLYESGVKSVPRKGRISAVFTAPPLSTERLPVISDANVKNASTIILNRSTGKNFYNHIVYQYDLNPLEDKYDGVFITQSSTSLNRIKTGTRPLTIRAKSVREGSEATIQGVSLRQIDRYQFGAESTKVTTNLKTGFEIEIGDAVLFGSGLKISDTSTGTREFEPKIFQVINKTTNLRTGEMTFEVTSTSFSESGRFGVFSPSSYLRSGSTTTLLRLEKSFGTGSLDLEIEKWESLVGSKVLVHSEDWAFSEETTFTSIAAGEFDSINVSPALSIAPSSDYIVDLVSYSLVVNEYLKQIYCWFDPSIAVTSGASGTVFDVADPSVFFVGSIVRVRNENYTQYSSETIVSDVTGNTITVEDDLGFTPSSSNTIELIGFVSDESAPYRFL